MLLLTAIIALSTVVYTTGTLLLWWTTREALNTSNRQWALQQEGQKAAVMNNIFAGHRDIFSNLLDNDALLAFYSRDNNLELEQAREKIFSTLLINHLIQIFFFYKYTHIPEAIWENVEKDIIDAFSTPAVKATWEEMKPFVPEVFLSYMEDKNM